MKGKPAIILELILVSVICAVLIKLAAYFCEPYITKNTKKIEQNAVISAMGIKSPPENELQKFFDKYISEIKADSYTIYRYHDNANNLKGLALKIKGMGFMGEIKIVLGLKPDLKTVSGIVITQHIETPGLGARITETAFLNQFPGKTISPELKIRTKKAVFDNEVDAITGATQTSIRLEKIINQNYMQFMKDKDKFKL